MTTQSTTTTTATAATAACPHVWASTEQRVIDSRDVVMETCEDCDGVSIHEANCLSMAHPHGAEDCDCGAPWFTPTPWEDSLERINRERKQVARLEHMRCFEACDHTHTDAWPLEGTAWGKIAEHCLHCSAWRTHDKDCDYEDHHKRHRHCGVPKPKTCICEAEFALHYS